MTVAMQDGLESVEPWGKTFRALLRQPIVWIAALGYFVDLFDLVLVAVYRVQSLRSLGLSEDEVFRQGAFVMNCQMVGMLLGGFAWGMLGDRRGRLSVLFGSIACYSIASFLNGFVTSVPQYAALRFISGFGLAGEFGVAVTLISETVPKHARGLASTFIAGLGFFGGMTAALASSTLPWRGGYILGGILGLMLLLSRFRMRESPLFAALRRRSETSVEWGKARWILTDRSVRSRYFFVFLVGVPIWYVAGILMVFSPEIGRDLRLSGEIIAGKMILLSYAGTLFGDLTSGLVSQWLRSRRRAIFFYLSLNLSLVFVLYFFLPGKTATAFYIFGALLGVANGYWALFALAASEQFGTNLRSTVTTSVTNLVRGFSVPLTLTFVALRPTMGVTSAATALGLTVMLVAYFGLWRMPETFAKDLDYVEGGK